MWVTLDSVFEEANDLGDEDVKLESLAVRLLGLPAAQSVPPGGCRSTPEVLANPR
jgi:hypothetical protein